MCAMLENVSVFVFLFFYIYFYLFFSSLIFFVDCCFFREKSDFILGDKLETLSAKRKPACLFDSGGGNRLPSFIPG